MPFCDLVLDVAFSSPTKSRSIWSASISFRMKTAHAIFYAFNLWGGEFGNSERPRDDVLCLCLNVGTGSSWKVRSSCAPHCVFPRETCVVHFSLSQRQDNMRGALNPPPPLPPLSPSLLVSGVNHMQPLLLRLSCAWTGLKSQTHFPLCRVHLCRLSA